MQKIGNLGGLKLTLKSAGDKNSFKVINGLKDFQASDEEGSGNEENKEDRDGESEEKGDEEGSTAENDSAEEESDDRKDYNESLKTRENSLQVSSTLKNLQGKIVTKIEPKTPVKAVPTKTSLKETPKLPNRPTIKQTPKRGPNEPIISKESPQTIEQPSPTRVQTPVKPPTPTTPDRRLSRQSSHSSVENVTIKQEVVTTNEHQQTNMPLFSGQIKTERMSPPKENVSTPIIAKIKSDPDASNISQISQLNVSNVNASISTATLLPVTKTEDTGPTIIEINGDSNDEDDDCCVVSATPAPDIKPIVPKTESTPTSYPPPLYPTSQPNYTSSASSVLSSRLTGPTSLAKQHNFNWNAPDSKPAIDMLEKSADDMFESLLSNSTKKESISLSEASEYISLDTLGPQHSCDVCNVRFTDMSLLDEHRRMTGHSRSIVSSSSASSLMPYNPTSNLILSSLLPVKQLADQVGKLSNIDSGGSGFTHQQNVMINIQAYPGASGVIPPPPLYNYPPGQNMPSNYPQGSNNMYNTAHPGPYGGQQSYMGDQGYGQFQSTMPNASFPGSMPTSPFSVANSQYTTASPLQSMQQAVYGQSSNGLSNPPGQMGPPGAPYVPSSSPGSSMKPSPGSSIRIQNVQTFPPGQLTPGNTELHTHLTSPGQMVGGQMPPPSQIRMANNPISGPRPRMPGIRGQRPSIRPGIQVHGQIRGSKPGIRMPMKRPANMMAGGTVKKRPNMLLPDKHDNEDCQVMAMQKQREGLPMIQSVQGAKDKINLGSQISITKKTVNKEASAMANVLASRGISIKQKQKSRSPTPERPVPHIPNLGAGVSIKHTSKSNNFSIPEAKVGSGLLSCKVCKKIFMNHNSLAVHMSNIHPQVEIPSYKCDECPASYPKSFQLQQHKRVFHNISGPNKELGLPVVDLSQEDNLKRLSNLGIYSFIPLANREQAGGCFGIPVISVHNMQNGLTNSLQALGADGLLSLGPLKPLPN